VLVGCEVLVRVRGSEGLQVRSTQGWDVLTAHMGCEAWTSKC
jgi:hypothetical protein